MKETPILPEANTGEQPMVASSDARGKSTEYSRRSEENTGERKPGKESAPESTPHTSKAVEKEVPSVLTVSNAKNPYHEALVAGGISEANLNPERCDRTINLQQMLEECKTLYQQADLDEWVRNVQGADLNNLTSDKRQMVGGLVKEGWEVIGVMPGRTATLKQMRHAMTKLKPVWIENSKKKSVDDGKVWKEYYKNLCNTLILETQKKFLANQLMSPNEQLVHKWLSSIPERPYLLLTPPTQSPDSETCSLDVDEQQVKFASKQQSMPQLRVLNPSEYAVTQARFTRMVRKEAVKTGKQMTTLDGLDRDTRSRFIDLPLSVGGCVPNANWRANKRQVTFGSNGAGLMNPESGFRLAVRVEI